MTHLQNVQTTTRKSKSWKREGDKLTHRIFDELGTTFITPFDREDIHDLASCMDDVIDGINKLCQTNLYLQSPSYLGERQRIEPFDSGRSDLHL